MQIAEPAKVVLVLINTNVVVPFMPTFN